MILLEEAVQRYALVAGDFGIQVARRKKPRLAARQLQYLQQRNPELRFPEELRHLWTHWAPQSFGSLFFDGLYRLDEVASIRQRDAALGYPSICQPLAYIEKAGVWVELETKDHPGGRIFHTYYHDAELRLWCVSVSSLIHLVAETIEQGGVIEPDAKRPWLDFSVFERIRAEQTVEMLAMPDEWRVPVADKSLWPGHWAVAEGRAFQLATQLQGRTHTVAEFERSSDRARVRGTLVGQINGLVAGGPIDGAVATFTDASGSVQVYASVEVERAVMQAGSGVQVEIDVIGEPPAERNSAVRERRNFMLRRSYEAFSANQLRVLEQMRKLDISVAVVAVRTIH